MFPPAWASASIRRRSMKRETALRGSGRWSSFQNACILGYSEDARSKSKRGAHALRFYYDYFEPNNIDLVPSGNTHTGLAPVGSGSISKGLFILYSIPEFWKKQLKFNGDMAVNVGRCSEKNNCISELSGVMDASAAKKQEKALKYVRCNTSCRKNGSTCR